MDCRMTRGIYLRANGEINCYCSTGEQVSLDTLPLDKDRGWDFVEDHYLSGEFDYIRRSFAVDRLPFPNQCAKCNYLAPSGSFDGSLVEKEVEWLHVEPCAICNIRCTFCVHGQPPSKRVWSRPKPHVLPRELFSKVLDDLVGKGINVRWMYFSGRGEPGLHPHLWDMVAEAKEKMNTNFLVNTNGNIPFDPMIVDSGLDKIKIALDSLDPGTYEQYRRGGKVDKLLDLTRRIHKYKEQKGSATPEIIWQKVLFDYNDSPEEMAEYQQCALDLGVDTLRLAYTYTAGHTRSDPEDLERIFPAIDILNNRDRMTIPSELIEKATSPETTPGDVFAVVLRLFHWFDLGMENRDDYDLFARLPLDDETLYLGRAGEPEFRERMGWLVDMFTALSRYYSQHGDDAEGKRYVGLAGKISEIAAQGA